MKMDLLTKSVFRLLPADINGKDVLIACNNALEWRDVVAALGEEVRTLAHCDTAINTLPSNQSELLVSKDNLSSDQYRGRFCAVIFFDPMSDEVALDILKNSTLSLLSNGGYVACFHRCSEHATYKHASVRSIEQCLKEVQQEGRELCLRFMSAKIINATKPFYCTVHKMASLKSRNFVGTDSFQEVLSNHVYSNEVVKLYEKLLGCKGFISNGANETAEAVLHKLKLQPGSRILDVGSGLGGNSLLLAKKYDAEVYGTDICTDLVDKATRTASEMPELKVDFEICDISLRNFPEASFDAIFSKDVIYHIEDKASLYKKFSAWLKPGGKILVADFTRCEEELSESFKAFMEFRKNTWFLLTLKQYEKIVNDAGFVNVTAEDVSYLQKNAIENENDVMKRDRDSWIQEFGEEFYDLWLSKWQSKYRDTQSGDHSWSTFYGEKPE